MLRQSRMERVKKFAGHLAVSAESFREQSNKSLSRADLSSTSGAGESETDASIEDFLLDTDGGRNQATHWNGWGYAVRLSCFRRG